jgi:spore cortex biosynthesis protein YabQ
MFIYVLDQLHVFFATVYTGFVIGIIYDLFGLLRRLSRAGRYLTGLLDLIFWTFATMFSFAVLFYVNSGEIRAYGFLGMILGFSVYTSTLSRFVIIFLNFMVKVLVGIFSFFLNTFINPVGMVLRACKRFIMRFLHAVACKFFHKKDPTDSTRV